MSGLGAKVININVNPDGLNINHHCGSTHIEGLQVAVQQHNADLGIANDGDADRCLLVDEKVKFSMAIKLCCYALLS